MSAVGNSAGAAATLATGGSRRAAPRRESSLQRQVLAHLGALPGCAVRKLHGAGYGTNGDPDLYGCIEGRMFLIELKLPGKQPTPLQEARLAEWRRAGAVAFCAHSLQEVCDGLRALFVEATP